MADINKTWQTAFHPLRTERARLDRPSTARRKAPLANDPTRRPPHGPMGRCATSPPAARPPRLQPDRRCQRGPSQVRWRTVSSPTVRCDSGRDAVVTGLPATCGRLWSELLGLES